MLICLENTGYASEMCFDRLSTSKILVCILKTMADLGGGARDAPPGSKFFHLHAVFGKNLAK